LEPYIRARDLAKTYPSGNSKLVVFAGLNLDVHRGEMLALVGESGAGKSSLLHLLGGLDRPSNGTIYYGRIEISGLADWEQADFRNRELGFVWQIHYLLPEFTALENVMMPLLIRGWAQRKEQQRVVLARALVGRPNVLLADEPTGNLDFRTGEMVFDHLENLHRTHSLTSILVTHNLSFARRCHRVLRLDKGGLVEVPSSVPSGGEPEYL
jgi:lipoprotein-releasing system ATP-binding protein